LLKLAHKKPVKAFEYWSKLLNIPTEDIGSMLYIPYQAVRDCKIQSLQFKIFHNIYICRKKLYQWKRKDSNICLDCDFIDDLPHHFIECVVMKRFWCSLKIWWHTICQCHDFDSSADILLGLDRRVCHKDQLNYIILKAKWYIYRTKYREEKISITDFLPELKNELDTEEFISRRLNKYEKFYTKWNEIQSEL
jgi:hypothetical protein